MSRARNRKGKSSKALTRRDRSEPQMLSAVAEPSLFSLPPEKVALQRALAERDPKLGQIYEGALRALADSSNPDSLSLAAHGFRELMEKFARLIAVPLRAHGENLTSKVRALKKPYGRMKRKCDAHSSIVDGNGQL